MIQIGRGIRWYNSYLKEVDFCQKNDFDFMQIWYKNGDILINDIPENKEEYIKKIGFPVIIHAVFDPVDFITYGDKLLDIVEYLCMHEVIVHPVSKKSLVDEKTENELAVQAKLFSQKAKSKGITWYLENNSVIDVFHYKAHDLSIVFNCFLQLKNVANINEKV